MKLEGQFSRINREVIFFSINLVFLVGNLYLAHSNNIISVGNQQLQNELLDLQRVTSDYASTIVVQPDSAFLNHTLYNYINSSLWETLHYGYLKLDLQIIIPHLGNFTVRVKEFIAKDSAYVNKVFPIYGEGFPIYEGTVGSGLNDITAEIYLRARAYVNVRQITSDDFVFQLGTLRLEVELYDLQTRTVAAVKEFDVPIVVTVEKPR